MHDADNADEIFSALRGDGCVKAHFISLCDEIFSDI